MPCSQSVHCGHADQDTLSIYLAQMAVEFVFAMAVCCSFGSLFKAHCSALKCIQLFFTLSYAIVAL